MSKILFIGDVYGKPGREILSKVLPVWKEKYAPDAVIVNVENMAHGKGVTPSTLAEIDSLGIDCFTGGNHIFDKAEQIEECFSKYPKLIRPANLSGNHPGYGFYRFSVAEQQFLVINMHGTVFCETFFDGQLTNPFLAIDKLLEQEAQKGDIIFIDFHGEATSEKIAFGYYCEGRVAAVVGTHTHVPTADARILPKGTAYISDVGMTGPLNGVIGVKYENVIKKFLDPEAKFKNEPLEEGLAQINGVLIEIENEKVKAVSIEKLYSEVS